MGSLDQAKVLGGVGSILTLLGLFPVIGTGLVVVGWALVLLALKVVSDAVQDRSIFNNAAIGAGLQMVGAVGLYGVGISIVGFFSSGTAANSNPFGFLGSVLGWLALLWLVALASSIFLYMSLKTAGSKLNVGLLGTAGLAYVIAEGTTIILIGFLIALVAQILLAAAFFSIPEKLPMAGQQAASISPIPQLMQSSSGTTTAITSRGPTAGENLFCTNCGASLRTGAKFCAHCGLPTNAG